MRRQKALTILEMLVSTAMLSFIVLGLTAVFIQTQRAFKTGIKSTTVTDAGRTILDMISADLSQMSDAQNTNVVNLYWSWNSSTNVQYTNGVAFRTNQLQAIYMLEHTNTMWMGVGYAVQAVIPGVGTLYRYQTNLDTPFVITNGLFTQFSNSVQFQNFTNENYWHRVADGVIDLKLRTFDQNGNEPYYESYYEDAPNAELSYPLRLFPYVYPFVSNTLPNAVDVEIGILEPEALARAQSIAGAPTALNNFMQTNSLTMMEVFRQRVSIPVVAR
jgi:type II secretory pathway pseudopilin PulG